MSDPEKVGESLLFFVLLFVILIVRSYSFPLKYMVIVFFSFKFFFLYFILKHLVQLIYFGGTKN